MARILITDGLEKNSVDELKKLGHEIAEKFYAEDELREQVKSFNTVIVRSATKITKAVIDGALSTKCLKLIIRGGVGLDNIDVAYARTNGITVVNTPDASSRAVAELAIGHMIALARYIHISNVTMRNGQWNKKQYEGIELSGKTLGLIGFGRTAKETAGIAGSIGMKIIYNTRSGQKEGYDDFEYVRMEELLRRSDFISLHIPFDKKKGCIIGPKEFELMKGGVYLINCARGGVVSEDALLEALDSGKVAGAALDVFEQEPTKNERLYTHKKVCLTPHIGASTIEAQEKIGKEIVKIIRDHNI